jgi:hypothetical protein
MGRFDIPEAVTEKTGKPIHRVTGFRLHGFFLPGNPTEAGSARALEDGKLIRILAGLFPFSGTCDRIGGK